MTRSAALYFATAALLILPAAWAAAWLMDHTELPALVCVLIVVPIVCWVPLIAWNPVADR
jgi:hypothetical protein